MINPLASDLENVLSATASYWEELRGSRIFITGGTGFFGCWLLETFAWINGRLNLRASAVVLSRNPHRLIEKAPHLIDHPAIQFCRGDVRDFAFPAGDFTHLIHAATDASAALNAQDPELMLDTIVSGTNRCLEFAVKSGVRKFLLTSSGAVYGVQPPEMSHIAETFSGGPDPLSPGSAYSEGKRIAELKCVLASGPLNLQVKIARCFAFLGPYMKLDQHFAAGNFLRDALAGGPIVVQGDGTPFRSYLYAADLMIWLWTLLFQSQSCRAYNVGSAQAVSIAELAHTVARAGGREMSVAIQKTPAPGPAARYVPSTERAESELGLKQQTSLQEAIERTLNWFHARNPNRTGNLEAGLMMKT